MTSPISDRSSSSRAAFTLVEVLVAIGIIALLAGVLLVAVTRIAGTGAALRGAADLQALSTALEAYKQDFGDIPRVDAANTGAAVLAKALLGPSPRPKTAGPFLRGEIAQQGSQPNIQYYVALADANAFSAPQPNPPASLRSDFVLFNPFDGADGLSPDFAERGFRVGPRTIDDDADGAPDRPGGRVWGPYVDPAKFKINKDAMFFVDGNNNPILYFPARPTKPNIAQTGDVVSNRPAGYVSEGPGGLFNLRENVRFFMRNQPGGSLEPSADTAAPARIRVMLGDAGLDGALNTQFGAAETSNGADALPYLLWTAGPDGFYGPPTDPLPGQKGQLLNLVPNSADQLRRNEQSARDTDDVTNFR